MLFSDHVDSDGIAAGPRCKHIVRTTLGKMQGPATRFGHYMSLAIEPPTKDGGLFFFLPSYALPRYRSTRLYKDGNPEKAWTHESSHRTVQARVAATVVGFSGPGTAGTAGSRACKRLLNRQPLLICSRWGFSGDRVLPRMGNTETPVACPPEHRDRGSTAPPP